MTDFEEQEPREPATPEEGPPPESEPPSESPFTPFKTEYGEKGQKNPGETRNE
jgi:hypothetical protein